jgi:FMN phosphatase YigB (HAD superfamily)
MSLDWDDVHLVVFDVDGTLYRQRPLRLRMARDLTLDALLRRKLDVVTVLASYRRIRERLGDEETVDFEHALIARTAAATASSPDRVRSIVSEWIDRRPLQYLAACRYPGLPPLFAGLRRSGKSIGVLSDYPARAKLEALGLAADHVVFAGDAGVGLLKPHPRGLQSLIAAAGVQPHQTLVIGDRADRDGLVARRAGARALIRSSKPIEGWQTSARFDDALFAPFLTLP